VGDKQQSSDEGNDLFMSGDLMIFQGGGRKDQHGEPPDQYCIDKMNEQVNKMPVPDIELIEMIIKGESKKGDGAVRAVIPPGFYIPQVADLFIIDEGVYIVKLEGTAEGVGIAYDAQEDDDS
jgi:hypothetical protein